MWSDDEKYDFSTKESQYLLKTFSETLYEILEKMEEKDKQIEEQVIELRKLEKENYMLKEDISKLNMQVSEISHLNIVVLLHKILRKIYRIFRKIAQKVYNLFRRIFRKRV